MLSGRRGTGECRIIKLRRVSHGRGIRVVSGIHLGGRWNSIETCWRLRIRMCVKAGSPIAAVGEVASIGGPKRIEKRRKAQANKPRKRDTVESEIGGPAVNV